ncbi:MAG: sensor histidine kinase [Planctomycetota bacterium]
MHRPRLTRQIWLTFTVLQLLALCALAWGADEGLHNMALGETERRLFPHAKAAADEINEDKWPLVTGSLDGFCKRHSSSSGARVTVVLPSGVVVGDSHFPTSELENAFDRPEIREALAVGYGVDEREGMNGAGDNLYLAVQVLRGDETLAIVRVAESLSYLDSPLNELRRKGVFIFLMSALSLSVMSWILSCWLTRPLQALGKMALDMAEGGNPGLAGSGDAQEFHQISKGLVGMRAMVEEQLAASRSRSEELEAVLSSMREGLVALDTRLKILRLNPAAMQMLGCDTHAVGRAFPEVCRNAALLSLASRSMSVKDGAEEDIPAAEDSVWRVQGHPLTGLGGDAMGVLLILQDVTRLRNLETMRRDFAANVSHELRTPVTAIRGFAETLMGGGVTPEESSKFLEIIHRQSTRLQRIIEDLLALARLEKDEEGAGVELERGSADAVAASALSNAQVAAARKGVKLAGSTSTGLVCRMNAPLLEQALGNLLDNAIVYSPEGSQINLEVKSQGPFVEFRVIDRGPGIAEEHLSRLFERFYRVDKARSRHSGGTGLGLAIVKHIARVHGGEAGVESALGQGSAFWLRVPAIL